jgi:hypothetical protein
VGTPAFQSKREYVCDHQFYWAHRVQQLGVGVTGSLRDELTVDSLDTVVEVLREALRPGVTTRAYEVAGRMRSQGCVHGARIAAEQLMNEFG